MLFVWPYFVLLILIGSFFMLNLVLGVLSGYAFCLSFSLPSLSHLCSLVSLVPMLRLLEQVNTMLCESSTVMQFWLPQ